MRSIKVGALKYAIRYRDHLFQMDDEDKPQELLGLINRDVGTITLSRICSLQVERMTLMHELVHAILFDCGFKLHDEHHVDMLANHFLALVRENPQLITYLSGKP